MLSQPFDQLAFLGNEKIWQNATNLEYRHRTDDRAAFFVGWHNREFRSTSVDEQPRLYVAVPDW